MARWYRLFVLSAGLCLASLTTLSAHAAEVQLAPRGFELRGLESSNAVSFELPPLEERRGHPEVALRWKLSEVVVAERSTLTVEVDGRSLRSIKLGAQPNRGGQLRLDLGELSGGFHTLKLSARLNVDGDPCLERLSREAWLALQPDSVLRWTEVKPGGGPPDLGRTLARFAAVKQAVVTVHDEPSVEGALTWLRADEMLHARGIAATTDKALPHRLELALSDAQHSNAALQMLQRALVDTEGARSALGVFGKRLVIVGQGHADLRGALDGLQWGQAEQLCRERAVCVLGDLASQANAAKPEPTSDELTVLSLESAGYREGWTAAGLGEHSLRLVWQRPATWKLDRAPVLMLPVSIAKSIESHDHRSTLSVHVGNVPLATYRLDQLEQQSLLKLKLPEQHWQAEVFDLRILVHLRRQGDVPCSEALDEAHWLHIAPEASLQVERLESHYDGIARFFEDANEQRPGLGFEEAPSSWDELPTIAALLAPFARAVPGQRWSVADEERPTVFIRHTLRDDGRVRANEQGYWTDSEKRLALPLEAARNMLYLDLRHSDDAPSRFEMVLSEWSGSGRLESPDYAGMLTSGALYAEGQWFQTQDGQKPEQVPVRRKESEAPPVVADTPVARSVQEQTLQWVNTIWAVTIGLLTLGGIYWLRRRMTPRTRAPRDLEYEKNS